MIHGVLLRILFHLLIFQSQEVLCLLLFCIKFFSIGMITYFSSSVKSFPEKTVSFIKAYSPIWK